MTIERICEIISADTKSKISECEIVLKIIELTRVNFKRAWSGYTKMREEGLINNFVQRHTIGSIDTLIENDQVLMMIDRFDFIPTKLTVKYQVKKKGKPSDYHWREIIPGTKMTREEILDMLCDRDRSLHWVESLCKH